MCNHIHLYDLIQLDTEELSLLHKTINPHLGGRGEVSNLVRLTYDISIRIALVFIKIFNTGCKPPGNFEIEHEQVINRHWEKQI